MAQSTIFSKKDISSITTYQSGVAQASAHRITSRVVSDFLLEYGLTKMQWFALGYIYDAGEAGTRVSHIMKQLDTTLPYITTTVNTLEAKGFVHKVAHAGDSRIKLIRVNPAKKSTIETIERDLRAHMRRVLYDENQITREELMHYIHVLFKIVSP